MQMTITLTTKMKSLMIILVLANLSEQRSIRRQLEFLPSTFPSAPTEDAPEKPSGSRLPKAEHSVHTSENDDQREAPITEDETLPPLLDMSAISQLLELLTRNATSPDFNSEAGAGGGGESSQGGSSGADALTTGNVKIDKLLANLEEPSERSKSIWMALLHDLVSNGSLTELLGNFIQESASQAKREDPSFPGLEGQEDLLEEQQPSPDQPGAPGSPLTQMEEFILEPHLGPAIMPFQLPEGFFVSFIPRRAFGVVNGVARPPHGHGSFYNHRPPGLVDVINAPAYGYHFHGYRRFDPDAGPFDESYFYEDEDGEFVVDEEEEGTVDE